jgi:cysteinyl-tRNA synthetase
LETAKSAFEKYLDSKLVKCLPTPVAAPSSATAQERFEAILSKFKSDSTWAGEAKAKEEKFEMYISSLSKAGEAIRIAEQRLQESDKGGKKGVEELMRDSADTIGPYLGTTVSYSSLDNAKLTAARRHNRETNRSLSRTSRFLGK